MSACVLLSRQAEGWAVCLVDAAHGPGAWLPLGLDASRPAVEAMERARALFPGRLVAVCSS
jgi:hypothetical protein